MADDKRRLVEGIISELQADAAADGGAASDDAAADGEGWASLDAPADGGAAALVEELVLLGFQQADAAAAVAAAGGGGQGASLADALDWLCVRLPEERLPKNFAPGGAGWGAGVGEVGPRLVRHSAAAARAVLTLPPLLLLLPLPPVQARRASL